MASTIGTAYPEPSFGWCANAPAAVPSKKTLATASRYFAVPMTSNDLVERPTTTAVPRPDAAHDALRSAPTNIRRLPALEAVEPHGI
jgi:hypothetical protein